MFISISLFNNFRGKDNESMESKKMLNQTLFKKSIHKQGKVFFLSSTFLTIAATLSYTMDSTFAMHAIAASTDFPASLPHSPPQEGLSSGALHLPQRMHGHLAPLAPLVPLAAAPAAAPAAPAPAAPSALAAPSPAAAPSAPSPAAAPSAPAASGTPAELSPLGRVEAFENERIEKIRGVDSDGDIFPSRNIDRITTQICRILSGREASGFSRATITDRQRQAIIQSCLSTGAFYQGEYLKIARFFLEDADLDASVSPEIQNHRLTCAAIALIAALHNPTGDYRQADILTRAFTDATFPLPDQLKRALLQKVNTLHRNSGIWDQLPRILEGLGRHKTHVRREANNGWATALSTVREYTNRDDVLRTLQTCFLSPADIRSGDELIRRIRTVTDETSSYPLRPAENALNRIIQTWAELQAQNTRAREISSFQERIRDNLNIAQLLEQADLTQELDLSSMPPRPSGQPHLFSREQRTIIRERNRLEQEASQRFPVLLNDLLENISSLQAIACQYGSAEYSPASFLRILHQEFHQIHAAYRLIVNRSIGNQTRVAGSLAEEATQDPSNVDRVIGMIGNIPAGGYVDTAAILQRMRAYLASSAITAIPYNRLIAIFDETFPSGHALPANNPNYLDPDYLRDFSANDPSGRGRHVSINAARGALQALQGSCEGGGANFNLVSLQYNVKRALEFIANTPDSTSQKNTILVALVSGGLHCIVGQHAASEAIVTYAFNGDQGPAAADPLNFIGKIDTCLYDLRERIFRSIIQFPGDAETGSTENNYRIRFADILRLRAGDPLQPHASWGAGYMGAVGGSAMDAPNDWFNLDALNFLRRFFHGKRVQTEAAINVHRRGNHSFTGGTQMQRTAERNRTYPGYTPETMLQAVLNRININRRGEGNLVADAVNYIAEHITPAEIQRYTQWALEHRDAASMVLGVEEPDDIRQALASPNGALRRVIANRLYIAENVIGTRTLKITPEGALRILEIRGHLVLPRNPAVLFQALSEITPSSVANHNGFNNFIDHMVGRRVANGVVLLNAADVVPLKAFSAQRLQEALEIAQGLWRAFPDQRDLSMSDMFLRTFQEDPAFAELPGGRLQPFELREIQLDIRQRIRDLYD